MTKSKLIIIAVDKFYPSSSSNLTERAAEGKGVRIAILQVITLSLSLLISPLSTIEFFSSFLLFLFCFT